MRVRRTKATAFGKSAGVHYTEHTGELTGTSSNLQLKLSTTTEKYGSPTTKLAKYGLASQSVLGYEDIADKTNEVRSASACSAQNTSTWTSRARLPRTSNCGLLP